MKKSIEPIRIEIPLGIMFPTVNCFLIPGEELTLIDCGYYTAENWQIFQEKVSEQGYQVSDIEQVIITHEHSDHIGLLPEIMAHSKAIIRMPKAIEAWFTQPEQKKSAQLAFAKKLFRLLGFPKHQLAAAFQFVEASRTIRKIEDLSQIQYFEEGDHLRFGNTDWAVLNTPGHCPTQYIFLQKEQKRVFGSDMLLPIAPMPIIANNPKTPGQPNRALFELLQSYERLKALDIQMVYPGHGKRFGPANRLINLQLDRIQQRKEECFNWIKSGLTTPYQINRAMYPYQQMPPDFSGLYMVLGYVDLLEGEGDILIEKEENGDLWLKVN